jgi:hypothetical protein
MKLNVTTIVGALVFIFGAFITGLELSQSGGGGGVYGSVFVGVVLSLRICYHAIRLKTKKVQQAEVT